MATYKIKLKSRSEVASGTVAFHFEKPDGFTFQPGQCGDFTLSNPPRNDAEGNKRSFSLACAPYEDDIFITTRMRDTAFKRSLRLIDLGTELDLEAPWGKLTLHNDTSIPAVFLTGGIGITPVRSIVLQATRDKLAHPLFAFYSNRTPHAAVFLDELTAAQKANPNFTLIATMTEVESSPAQWSGETGYITEAMLKRHISDLNRPIYYLTGPPEMVAAMQKLLKATGVKETASAPKSFQAINSEARRRELMVKLKRVYEAPDKEDGTRILVDRLWPRGLTKEKAKVDLWLKDVAPSTELRKWFGHDPDRWHEFQIRYKSELKNNPEQVALLKKETAKGKATLLYGAKDEQHNEAIVLQQLLNH